jgi:raffinose/stachyose/melibiose transport system permease protein
MRPLKKPIMKFFKFGAFPLAVFIAVLTLPRVRGSFFTFTNWDGFGLDFEKFVGVANYVEALKDEAYWQSLQFTAMYVVVCLVLVNAVAFGLALLVTAGLRSANVLRTFFFIPNLIGGVILGFIWQFVFNRTLTTVGKNFEIPFLESSWLNAPESAFWALVIVTVWQMSGYMMIIYITGLMSIEADVLEAAMIDGASAMQTLWSIRLPLMAQAFTISIFLTLRNSFMAYDVNVGLTGGGPYRSTELVSMHIFNEAFMFGFMGTGQAKAVFMFLIIAAVALVQVAVSKRFEVQR